MSLALNASRKIRIAALLFALRGVIHLGDGVVALFAGATYGEYGNAFVMSAIYAFITYGLFGARANQAWWLAIFFAGIVIIRGLVVAPLFLSEDWLQGELLFAIMYAGLFGIVPLILLLGSDVRSQLQSGKAAK